MASNGKEIENIAYLIGLGGFFFIYGFRRLKLRRQIMALATSRARSMAMGTVELAGIAVRQNEILDPVHKKACAYYNIKVEEYRRSGKSGSWVTIFQENSDGRGFFCKDTTGQVLILPKEPEINFIKTVWNRSLFNSNKPAPEAAYLSRWGGNTRLVAHILREGDPIYVLGCALPTQPMSVEFTDSTNATPAQAAALLKKDAERMKAMDTNKDGRVDENEWEAGLKAYQAFLQGKKGQKTVVEFSGIVTGTKEIGLVFAHSEADIINKLGTFCFFAVFGGGAALILGLILLLQKLH